ncbi:MAG: TadE/TadG family type IV pilus assembly protein [Nocardioides sp.]
MTRTGWLVRRSERGSVAIETAMLVVPFGFLIAMVLAGGRVAIARQSIDAAAYDAARAASIERTQSAAIAAGKAAASSGASDQGLQCSVLTSQINTTAFNAPIGTTGQVTATLTCRVNLSDLIAPGLPGQRVITATASSPVDAFRERR